MTTNIEITETPYPWTKSSMSQGSNNGCVAWQWQVDGGLKIRDDKDPEGRVQTYTRHEADCFLFAISNGELTRPADLDV